MLEHPSIRRYSFIVTPLGDHVRMSSDNPTGGDNQQETESPGSRLDPHWVVGFVDGEGCFSVSVHRNPVVHQARRWQLQPSFQVTQHDARRAVLEELALFFGTGRISAKGPNSRVSTFAVYGLRAMGERILPFFELHPLVVKDDDFRAFAHIVRAIQRKEHLHPDGFERLVRLAYGMNAAGKQRTRTLEEILDEGSSETVRQGGQHIAG